MMERLEKTYDKMLELVKYAESKNIALISFLFGFFAISTQIIGGFDLGRIGYLVVFIHFAITIFISGISFVPLIERSKYKKGKKTIENLLFFNEIAQLDLQDNSYGEQIGLDSSELKHQYTESLVTQIITNAKIASRKFFLFTFAVRYFFVVPLLFYFVKKR